MSLVYKQNTFSRALANDAKAGAYYTDTGQCRSIASFYEWPDEEVCVLEPSIGNGEAVRTVCESARSCKLFGVELQKEVARETKEKCEACICADFLSGVKITNSAFSFCFCNPPYGIETDGMRYETLFLEKLSTYLCIGGRLCLVVPDYILEDKYFRSELLRKFTVDHIFRFREPVYSQFKQSVVMATRKGTPGYSREDAEAYDRIVEEMADLPVEWNGEKIPVLPSSAKSIRYFQPLKFDAETALDALSGSPIAEKTGNMFLRHQYIGNDIKSPIIPLSQDLYYLLAVSGAGQGRAGTIENGDLHLQRGTVRREKHRTMEVGEKGESSMVEREFSSISVTLIEQRGLITKFEGGEKHDNADRRR